jgi:hypothetical protein
MLAKNKLLAIYLKSLDNKKTVSGDDDSFQNADN